MKTTKTYQALVENQGVLSRSPRKRSLLAEFSREGQHIELLQELHDAELGAERRLK